MFVSDVSPRSGSVQVTSKDQRELRIISHFTADHYGPVSFQHPIKLHMNSIHIGFACVDVSPTETLTALNGSFVMLCCDTRPFKPNRLLVTLLKETYPIRCVGCAIVKAIDKKNGIIYVIGREDLVKNIEAVNTIIMGSVQIPVDLLIDSPRADPNYLGIGLLQKVGASAEPLALKQTPVFE